MCAAKFSFAGLGGGIFIKDSATLDIWRSNLTGNQATVTDADANAHGGAIYAANNTVLRIADSLLQDNTADNGDGGGIALGNDRSDDDLSSEVTLVVERCNFLDNYCDWWGGALSMYSSNDLTNASISNSLFRNNSADGGGAIYAWYPYTLNVTRSQFVRNDARGDEVTYSGASSEHPDSGNGGGVLVYLASTVNFENCTFTGNHGGGKGGALHLASPSTGNRNVTSRLADSSFVTNR